MKTITLRISLILLFSIFSSSGFSQASWTKTFGGIYDDEAYTVHQTFDGGYILTGSFVSEMWNTDVWLIRTNGSGDTLWTKTYGGINGDVGLDVKQTTDNGFIISGITTSFGVGNADVWLIKTDINGDSLWTKTFGGAYNEYGNSVFQTADNGYVIIGSTESFGAGNSDFWMIKTNSVGDSLWSKTYGGYYNDIAFGGEQTSDDGFVLTGYTQPAGFSNADVWLIKTDHLGEIEWSQTYGGSLAELANSVQQTYDEGYIITGYTMSYGSGSMDLYLIKTDMYGDTMWTKTFGGLSNEAGNSVIETAEGDFVVSGYTMSYTAGGDMDLWMIKTDISGYTLWTKTYGGSGAEIGFAVIEAFDGGLTACGYTSSYGAGQTDIWLLHTDLNGTVGIVDHQSPDETGYRLDQNYPNPFSRATTIEYYLPASENVSLKIYDLSGRLIAILVDEFQQFGKHSFRFEEYLLKKGIYYYRLQSGTFDCTRKLIISQ